jgi:hypothetical protein
MVGPLLASSFSMIVVTLAVLAFVVIAAKLPIGLVVILSSRMVIALGDEKIVFGESMRLLLRVSSALN